MGYLSSEPVQSEVLESKDVKLKERIMIYEAFLELVVLEPDSLREPFQKIAQKYEGYLVRFSPESAGIRVKSENLNQALAELELLGKVRNKRITGEDVTDYYLDAQIRLENAEKTRKRFLELLDKAQNVEEILQIEKELGRINEQIDLLKGKINALDQRAALSLIEINIHQKVKLGPLGYITYGLYKGVAWLFVRN
ncbi:MAG: DUF4349 domain-containing protein [Microscillaceae bacterium]|nr:DUF4349 domain-containing protein [Microscillaceae bacterium]